MNIEILEVKAKPYTRWWESDKNNNRWHSLGDYDFRYRVTVKLKIDGKVVEAYKDTKHFRLSEDYIYDWFFAEALQKEVKKQRAIKFKEE